jgi:branched-chain amino acid transport system ATP-binding protein
MSAVLEVRELAKAFGGINAVNGVSFDVREGEILGLIGPNGSGKSTLFNCILGQLPPSAGEVRIDGRPITGMRPCSSTGLGVGRTFQLLQVFPSSRCARTWSSRGRSTGVDVVAAGRAARCGPRRRATG